MIAIGMGWDAVEDGGDGGEAMDVFGDADLGEEDEARGGVVSFSTTAATVFGDTGNGDEGDGTSVTYLTTSAEILCHAVIFSR